MILEAFAAYLHNTGSPMPATEVLARWLWERLSSPPEVMVDRVLHCEVEMCVCLERNLKNATAPVIAINAPTTFAVDPPEVENQISRKNLPGSARVFVFRGTSDSGRRMLKSLYDYCLSFEQQKWARFVHHLKASDFSSDSSDSP